MRIVGGSLRGRALATPREEGIRPTSDRLRESIFDILEHNWDVQNARVLDLFAGTGAMGIEALSRFSPFAAFVDTGAQARGLIRENLEAVGYGHCKVLRRDAANMGQNTTMSPFSVVFCDPPYNMGLAPKALRSCADGGWLFEGGTVIVVEESRKSKVELPKDFEEVKRRAYGETEIVFATWTASGKPFQPFRM